MVVNSMEGGLGNQAFQTAFLYAYAKKHGLDYAVYTKVTNPHIYDKGVYNLSAYRFQGINYTDNEPNLPIYKEQGFTYYEVPKMDNVCFKGFWQSWKYFDEYREDVLKAFGLDDLPTNDGWVAIHIRRGDYLLYPNHHPTITLEYIYSAIEYFNGLRYSKFLIFSDDTDWCLDNIKMPFGCVSVVSDGKTELEDMALASSCEHNIGSNSSFSWWIYYLNQNKKKIGIFPKTWFGELLPHDVKDLLLPESIVL